MNGALPGGPPARRPPPVRDHHGEPLVGEPLRLQERLPNLRDASVLWPAVRIHQNGQRPVGGRISGWEQQGCSKLTLAGELERGARLDGWFLSERHDVADLVALRPATHDGNAT